MAFKLNSLFSLFTITCIIALSSISCKKVEQRSTAFSEGDLAPTFELEDLNGKLVKLEQFKGKVLLINFWATWCAPCLAEMPALQAIAQRFRKQGFEILAVSVDRAKDQVHVQQFAAKSGADFVILRDPLMGVSRRYGVTGFPESIFIDRSGRVVSFTDPQERKRGEMVIGDRQWDNPDYINEIERILAE